MPPPCPPKTAPTPRPRPSERKRKVESEKPYPPSVRTQPPQRAAPTHWRIRWPFSCPPPPPSPGSASLSPSPSSPAISSGAHPGRADGPHAGRVGRAKSAQGCPRLQRPIWHTATSRRRRAYGTAHHRLAPALRPELVPAPGHAPTASRAARHMAVRANSRRVTHAANWSTMSSKETTCGKDATILSSAQKTHRERVSVR